MERWHLNGFNLCEIIIIRDGPSPDGKRYLDGHHQIRVALFELIEDAYEACDSHNEKIK